jgi:hypothetical protein
MGNCASWVGLLYYAIAIGTVPLTVAHFADSPVMPIELVSFHSDLAGVCCVL